MIRTSTMEIIKGPDELNRLLENGLLSTVDDVAEVVECAETVLPHRCDERCLRRVGDGEGPENFRCRKLHPVRDNPDPTSHAYIPFDHDYDESTLHVLEEIGLYLPPPEGSGPNVRGTFGHPFFEPTRHLPPCNQNAKCNMSPVIPDFLWLSNPRRIHRFLHTPTALQSTYASTLQNGQGQLRCALRRWRHWKMGPGQDPPSQIPRL